MRSIRTLAMIVFGIAAASSASAQTRPLDLDFSRLAAKAAESVEVTLDGKMLRLASGFLSSDQQDEKSAKEIIRGLDGIYVRSFEFDQEGAYDIAEADKVRRQLGPEWQKIVNVKNRNSENVEIYLLPKSGDRIGGMVIIAAEPKEFTVVQLVGPIDLEKLGSIEGQFGIPHIDTTPKGGKE
ncbi:MAG: DUF4252 domain-containing protein [Thermoanaerobaculia bacterium]